MVTKPFWHAARELPRSRPAELPRRRALGLTTKLEQTALNRVRVLRWQVLPSPSQLPQSYALDPAQKLSFRPSRAPLPLGLTVTRPEAALVRVHFELPERYLCVGLGERYGGLNLRGRVHTLLNTDDHHHLESTDSLYKSIPFLLLVDGSRTLGLFVDSPAPQRWELARARDARAKLDIYSRRGFGLYALGPASLPEIVAAYTKLTGRTPAPPRFSLGHQQSRWSYPTESRVREVAAEFRARQIPCDTLVLDIDYLEDYRQFVISRKRFPNFEGMISDLRKDGFHVITIVDPGIPSTRTDPTYVEGMRRDVFCRTSQGKPFVGRVWPGRCCFPDFLREDVRRFWGERLEVLLSKGVAGLWNDMNEPALFEQQRPFEPGLEGLPPDTAQLFVEHTPEGEVGHFEVRNLYGMQMARAAQEAQLAARPDRRPFTLTRATYAGGQRFGAVWLGDNMSWFEHLRSSVPMLLNMGLCGFAFAGVDIGGFGGNCDAELLMRWYQTGIFYPFFRNHCALGQHAQEPWAFGPEVERVVAHLIRVRYQLTQYIEQLFVEHRETGAPLMRPLFFHYPNDQRAREIDDQFLFGSDLLVAPILARGKTERVVYFPEGLWEPFEGGAPIRGPSHQLVRLGFASVPAFVRHGCVLPLVGPRQHLGQPAPLTLRVYGGRARGRLYLDDGDTFAFERGVFDDYELIATPERLVIRARHRGYPERPRRLWVERDGHRLPVKLDGPTRPSRTSGTTRPC